MHLRDAFNAAPKFGDIPRRCRKVDGDTVDGIVDGNSHAGNGPSDSSALQTCPSFAFPAEVLRASSALPQ
jgi:hypothetical protein